MAESAENIFAMKRNQNIYNDVPAISSRVVPRKSLGLATSRASNMLGRTGLGIRRIWGIHSHTLIISCLRLIPHSL